MNLFAWYAVAGDVDDLVFGEEFSSDGNWVQPVSDR